MRERMKDYISEYKELWYNSETTIPASIPTFSFWEKHRIEVVLKKGTHRFLRHITHYHKEHHEEWVDKGKAIIAGLTSPLLSYVDGDIDHEIFHDMSRVGREFYQRAKQEFPDMSLEDIGQALRNVWIIMLIQLLHDKKVALTDSCYAYSMLYPITDNFLDDADLDYGAKKRLMRRFTKRLKGEQLEASHRFEVDAFRMVELIENQYPRDDYPQVYDSLNLIQEAQVLSLTTHGVTMPFEKDLLAISIFKGGASVLADAYLAVGNLTHEEEHFYVGYGLILQLGDDLQDAKMDYDNRHGTMFSVVYKKNNYDLYCKKLLNLSESVFDLAKNELQLANHQYFALVASNIHNLVIYSAMNLDKVLSKECTHAFETHMHVHHKFMKRFSKDMKKRIKRLKTSYHGVETKEIIDAFLKSYS